MKTISVVIPVYNEEKYMARCLDAIINNTVKPLEILVCDGMSDDKTVEIAKRYSSYGVKVLNNPKRTAAGGRNVGILNAKGDIIAFTDGDCIVAEDWIQAIEEAFENNDIDGMGGKVIASEPANKYEAYWNNLAWNLLMNFGDDAYVVEKKTLNDAFVTANCAYTRKMLYKVKGFSNWFGNNAEDVDISWRMFDAGAKLMYMPTAKIYAHGVTTLKGIAKKSYRNGVSSSKLQKRYGSKVNYDVNIYKMLGSNIVGLAKKQKDADLNTVELVSHLFGKYHGSVKYKVINV